MSNITLILTIIGMGVITFAIRVSFFLLPEGVQLPERLLRALRYVPAAVPRPSSPRSYCCPVARSICRWAMSGCWPAWWPFSSPGARATSC